MSDFLLQLRALIADRRSPEAQALYLQLLEYADRRARRVWTTRYPDLLSEAEVDEAVADVVTELMTGALARFRGESLPELLAFVRTMCDRQVGARARRRLRERDTLAQAGGPVGRSWLAPPAAPADEALHQVPESPLSERDQAYLRDLLAAGSKAELARLHGHSRAAVTRMVQRIQSRIAALGADERLASDAWLAHNARLALGLDEER